MSIVVRPSLRPKMIRLGSKHGGWWIPEEWLIPGATVYSVGVGMDTSFDEELLSTFQADITLIDPTPAAHVHVARNQALLSPMKFVPLGLWDHDGSIAFFAPKAKHHASYSALNLQSTSVSIDLPVRTLKTLMFELGDSRLDLMKIDIEGAENKVIPSFLHDGIRPRLLLVEFDQLWPFRETWQLIRLLRSSGYIPIHSDKWNWTFVHVVIPESVNA